MRTLPGLMTARTRQNSCLCPCDKVPDTDALIHEVLQKEIEACNVIAVVHNFNLEVAVEFSTLGPEDQHRSGPGGKALIRLLPVWPFNSCRNSWHWHAH
jgi:hypothetical protein